MKAEPPSEPISRSRTLCIALAVGLGVSAGPLDSAVNVAFPAIIAAFDVTIDSVQWIVVSYVLTYSCLLLGFGRLADLVGHKRVFVIGIVWSIVALLLCSQAARFDWFLLGRFVQGIGTAALLSTGPALMTLSFPENQRTRVLAWYALMFASANALGPLAGGLVVSELGWASVFWMRIPLLLMALVLAWQVLPDHVAHDEPQSFDWLGALAFAACVLVAMAALNRFGTLGFATWLPWGLLGLAVMLLYTFVRKSLATSAPLIELRLFRLPVFASANVAHVLVNMASFSIMLLAPFYLARVVEGDALKIGMFLCLYPVGAVIASLIAPHALRRLDALVLSQLGLSLAALGLFIASAWPIELSAGRIVAALALHGFGYGLFQVAAVDVVMSTVSRRQQGVGGSLNMLTRTLGVVAGASLGSVLFTSMGGSAAATSSDYMSAHSTVFSTAGGVVLLAIALLAWTGHRIRTRNASTPGER